MGGDASTDHINDAMNKDVSTQQPIANTADIMKALPTTDTLRYVENDTFVADPSLILGRVYYERSGDKSLTPFHTSIDSKVDEKSILTSPQTVSELIIDSKLSSSLSVLAFVSLSLSQDEVYELRIINNTAARLVDKGDQWDQALTKWMNNPLCQQLINNPKVGAISIVTGVVQKYLTSKKYKKFEAGTKGGGWGVNVAGNLYMSSSEFQLDVIYGLDLVSFGRVSDINEFAENIAKGKVLSNPADLASVNRMFDNMAMDRTSVFRLSA